MQSAEPTEYEIEHARLCSLPIHPCPDREGYWRPGLTYQQWLFGRILPVMISRHARLFDAITATESAIHEILRREAEAEVGDSPC
jgi:hypothetical protein